MTQLLPVVVPDLGDVDAVDVIAVLVKAGDVIARETPLITLETDKATMDVPSSAEGKVVEVKAQVGTKVRAGDVIAMVEAAGAAASAAAPSKAAAPVAPPPAAPPAASVAPPPATAAGSVTHDAEVRVPDLGDFSGVDVIELIAPVGATVSIDDALVTLESDKATMDVPSPVAGTVIAYRVKKGDKVSGGDVVAVVRTVLAHEATVRMDLRAMAPQAAPAPPAAMPAAAPPQPPAMARIEAPAAGAPPVEAAGFSRAHASPSVRRFARELGVDLGRVKGSGTKGRVTQEDVKAFVKQALAQPAGGPAPSGGGALPKVPAVDFAKFGPVETRPLSRIQKISGARLHASWVNLPHVTQFDQADITDLESLRASLKDRAAERGIKLTPLAFLMRAVVVALREFPHFNASLDAAGENLVLKRYVSIGFAADTPGGLVVPVVKDADRMDIYEVAGSLASLAEKARAGKLPAADMQGGTFTISSLGGIGGTAFTPIINAPEVAILGVSKSEMRPVWRDGAFVPRLMLPLSLSYDHRVIDGADAARFTSRLAQVLANPGPLAEAVP